MSNKHNQFQYVTVLSILILMVGGWFLFYGWLQHKKEADQNIIQYETLKTEWQEYVSFDMGFSIKIPKATKGAYLCQEQKTTQIPVVIFEDKENDTIYIAPEYRYEAKYDSEVGKLGLCERTPYSLDVLKKEYVATLGRIPMFGLVLTLKRVNDENDIISIVKETFGNECSVVYEKPLIQAGIFEIFVKNTVYAALCF